MTPTVPGPVAVPPDPNLEGLIDYDSIVTDDGVPVDNIYVEKQQRLLTASLYDSWPGPGEGRPFLALSNVGLFYQHPGTPIVPDAMLSLDVAAAEHLRARENRSYFIWVFGKQPDAAIEIVSDRRGGEDGEKMRIYARIGVPYYIIYDPENHLGGGILRAFRLNGRKYLPIEPSWLPEVGLGLKLWTGTYEGVEETWLRWCDQQGNVIATGEERAAAADRKAAAAVKKLERLQAQLRALGVEPEA